MPRILSNNMMAEDFWELNILHLEKVMVEKVWLGQQFLPQTSVLFPSSAEHSLKQPLFYRQHSIFMILLSITLAFTFSTDH